MEFYLFKIDELGQATTLHHDRAGYMDIVPDDKGEHIRREICLMLEQMGIQPESSHHESGPGQNEIDFRYSDPLTAADNAITFQAVVRMVAAQNGLCASFMPKPLPDWDGRGMHINISAKGDGGRDLLPAVMAGILEKCAEITLFLNPCEESYRRLGHDKAPRYVTWSDENRLPQFFKASAVLVVAALIGVAANLSNLYHTYTYSKETMRGKSELVQTGDAAKQTSSGLDRDYITNWSYGIGETWTLLVPNFKGGSSSAPLSQSETAMEKANPMYSSLYNSFPQYFGDQPWTGQGTGSRT